MGEWKKARNIKWGSDTERKVGEIQDAFSPFCANRSATIRTMIDMFHTIIFTDGILEKLGDVFQGLQMAHRVRTFEVPSPGKPGPIRATLARDLEDRKARRTGTNSTTCRVARAVAAAIPVGRSQRRYASGITPSVLRFRSSFASRVA